MSVTPSFSTLPQRIEIAFWTAVIPLMKEVPLTRLPLPRLPRRPVAHPASALRPATTGRLQAAGNKLLVQVLGFGLAGLALGFTLGYVMVFMH